MKFNDSIFGIFLIVLAVAEITYAQMTFPALHGQRFDAADFPTLLGIGLIICGIVLIANGLQLRAKGLLVGAAFFSVGDWMRSNRLVLNFALVIFGVVFFIFALDALGFLICSTLILLVLFYRFGSSAIVSIICSILVTAVIYGLFALILKVPLPLGVLQG